MTTPCILVVETDLAVRHPLAEFLRECGYRIIEAANTDEAKLVLSASETAIDFVLADVSTTRPKNGFSLAKWMREKGVTARIILAGTVAKVVEKASALCEEGPALVRPQNHIALLNRIKKNVAARERNATREA